MIDPVLLPVLVPAAAGVLALACAGPLARAAAPVLVIGAVASAAAAASAVLGPDAVSGSPGQSHGLALALRLDALARPFVGGAAALAAAAAPLAARALHGRAAGGLLAAAFLLALAALQGAFLAADTTTLLLCWEGLLLPLLVLAAAGRGPRAVPVALRAFVTCAVADLALVAALAIVEAQAGAELASARLAAGGTGALALALVVVAAAGRAGAVPFQGWTADAAEETPAPFLALLPPAGAKLAAAYLLLRAGAAFGPLDGVSLGLLVALGAASLAGGLVLAPVQLDPRRRAAQLSVAVSGAVLLAVAFAPALAPATAVAGAAAAGVLLALAGRASARSPAAGPAVSAASSRLARGLRGAERFLEPGAIARGATDVAAAVAFGLERTVNALFDRGATGAIRGLAALSRRAHDGSHATYIAWSLAGVAAILVFLVGGR